MSSMSKANLVEKIKVKLLSFLKISEQCQSDGNSNFVATFHHSRLTIVSQFFHLASTNRRDQLLNSNLVMLIYSQFHSESNHLHHDQDRYLFLFYIQALE